MGKLFFGDNLNILRDHFLSATVDLVYLDPPFNSKRNYNVLFKTPKGLSSDAQITAFEDSWVWGEQAEREYSELLHQENTDVAEMIESLRRFLKESPIMAYLVMMANRLVDMHRVLKPTGSLYLHCDPTASHYLKILLDTIFGATNFRTEIIWKRSSAHSDTKQGRKQHGRIHDILLFYTKSDEWLWNSTYTPYDESYLKNFYRYIDEHTGKRFRVDNLTAAKPGGDTSYDWRVRRREGTKVWEADLSNEYKTPQPDWEYKGVPPYKGRYWAYSYANLVEFAKAGKIYHSSSGIPCYKRYLDEMSGVPLQDLWDDITPIGAQAAERLGYPTQKPLALLERIIQTSSNPGDLVLDPFCGCGTAVHAAQKLGREWAGIDITHLAISLIEKRMKGAFPGMTFEVHGTPKDLDSARNLAERDKYQFQWWACALVSAQPYQGKKKGADGGIDGIIFFQDDPKTAKKIIVSVKGGEHVTRTMIADLKNSVEREKAQIGLFVTLNEPTKPMQTEALSAGFYESPHMGSYPKIQILTIEGLLSGKERPNYPDLARGGLSFKKAKVEEKNGSQLGLGLE